jgi:threonine dehydrogenase-like Zn-dependent dehydrogenase
MSPTDHPYRHSLLLTAPRHLVWAREILPPLQADEVLVQTTAGAISIGSELPIYCGTARSSAPVTYPRMTGYESVGRVVACGSAVTRLRLGDRVVAFYGHRTHGVISEAKAIPVPDEISDALALLAILTCDMAKGVRKVISEAPALNRPGRSSAPPHRSASLQPISGSDTSESDISESGVVGVASPPKPDLNAPPAWVVRASLSGPFREAPRAAGMPRGGRRRRFLPPLPASGNERSKRPGGEVGVGQWGPRAPRRNGSVREGMGAASPPRLPDAPALITGAGAIGLLTLFMLQAMGVQAVDVVEPRAERRALATQLGARRALETVREDASYAIGFECSSRDAAFALLQRALQPGGRICVLADGNIEPLVLTPAFHEKELLIVGSSDGWDYPGHARWFFSIVGEQAHNLEQIFDYHTTAANLIATFAHLASGAIRPIKVLVEYKTSRASHDR